MGIKLIALTSLNNDNNMIRYLFLILTLCTTWITSDAFAAINAIDTVKTVSAIKGVFQEVNAKRKTYEQYIGEHGENPKERTAIIGFYEGSELKMISAGYYSDERKSETEQYLLNKQIGVIYAKDYEYTESMAKNPGAGIRSMTENWYYFSDGNLIKWVNGGKVIPAGAASFKKKSKELKEKNKVTLSLFADKSKLQKFK